MYQYVCVTRACPRETERASICLLWSAPSGMFSSDPHGERMTQAVQARARHVPTGAKAGLAKKLEEDVARDGISWRPAVRPYEEMIVRSS